MPTVNTISLNGQSRVQLRAGFRHDNTRDLVSVDFEGYVTNVKIS